MKTSKFLALTAALLTGSMVFADAANTLISFSTTADFYADGTAVKDGEWYALVWSADGVFEGLNLDCTPVDANDKVIYYASLAKDGHCGYTIFQIDSKDAPADGVYAVYLLDTRDAAGNVTTGKVNEKPAFVNGAVATKEYTASTATANTTTATEVAGATWGETAVAGDVTPAKITAFEVKGAKVEITVGGMLPGVKYNVKMGADVKALDNYAFETPKTTADEAKFVIDANDAKFFQVVREPLTK